MCLWIKSIPRNACSDKTVFATPQSNILTTSALSRQKSKVQNSCKKVKRLGITETKPTWMDSAWRKQLNVLKWSTKLEPNSKNAAVSLTFNKSILHTNCRSVFWGLQQDFWSSIPYTSIISKDDDKVLKKATKVIDQCENNHKRAQICNRVVFFPFSSACHSIILSFITGKV